MAASNLQLLVCYNSVTLELTLPSDSTIDALKNELFAKTGIHPEHQIIKEDPDDETTVSSILKGRIVWLSSANPITETSNDTSVSNAVLTTISELASSSFINQYVFNYGDNYVTTLKDYSLSEALERSCLAPVQFRKPLALYLHNEDDAFSKNFCPMLKDGCVRNILERSFHVLGWDMVGTNDSALEEVVSQWFVLEPTKNWIRRKQSAVFILYPFENSFDIYCIISSTQEIEETLGEIENSFHMDIVQLRPIEVEEMPRPIERDSVIGTQEIEETLGEIENSFHMDIEQLKPIEVEEMPRPIERDSVIGSREYQQMMFDRLGDRDYDCHEKDEHTELKDKIGFAKFGCRDGEEYNIKQQKEINETFKVLRKHNNKFSEYEDCITVAFIYNCTELLKNKEHTSTIPFPVFVLQKCTGSSNPCRIFVDHDNRVYSSWEQYKKKNKLPKCNMILPKEGRYCGNSDGEVLLEWRKSPSCGVDHSVLQGTDIASSVVGIASGAVVVGAAIPAIAVAPILLTVAAATGVGVGAYGILRSVFKITDRAKHNQTMSIKNSEARGAYLTIAAGSLGFVGAGATTAVSQLATRGVAIGQGAKTVVNVINAANVGVSATSIINSSYEVIDNLIENGKVSTLSVIQLSSSILFFGNAVYNFRTADTIIAKAQLNTLKKIEDSLPSNRQRYIFNKLLKESIRQDGSVQGGRQEVIASLSKVTNTKELIAILSRNNKAFNKDGVRFAAKDGKITLNGVKVDINEVGTMSVSDRTKYLIDLPSTPNAPSVKDVQTFTRMFEDICNVRNLELLIKYTNITIKGSFLELAIALLKDFSSVIQRKIINIFDALLGEILIRELNVCSIIRQRFPNADPYFHILKLVVKFIKSGINEYETKYRENTQSYPPLLLLSTSKRAIYWVEQFVDCFLVGGNINVFLLNKLVEFVFSQLTSTIVSYFENADKMQRRQMTKQNKIKTDCSVCGGTYWK